MESEHQASKIFESEDDLLITLDEYDRLVYDCAAERITFSEFLDKYDTFYMYYALDGHESDQEEQKLFARYDDRISLHREIWEKVIGGGLCSDEDAQKKSYIRAGRFGSEEGLRRLQELCRERSPENPHA